MTAMLSLQARLRIPCEKKAATPTKAAGRPRRFTAALEASVLLAVLYPLSFGPVVYASRAGYLNWDEEMLLSDVYRPVLSAREAPLSGWMIRAYIDWWSRMGSAAASKR